MLSSLALTIMRWVMSSEEKKEEKGKQTTLFKLKIKHQTQFRGIAHGAAN